MMEMLALFEPDDVVMVQDNTSITAADFERITGKVAGYIKEKFPDETIIGVQSDNDIYGLLVAVGVARGGKNVLPLSTLNDGAINDYTKGQTGCSSFVGYGTELDHSDRSVIDSLPDFTPDFPAGDFVFLSSGSTGKPKLHLNNCIRIPEDVVRSRNKMFFSRLPEDISNKAFYAAPLMSAGIGSALSMICIGIVPVMTNQIPTTEVMQDLIVKNNVEISTGRPTIIERFMAQGMTRMPGIRAFMSSGSALEKKHIDFCHETLGVPHIMDCYVTSEAGIIALRDAVTEDRLTLMDDIEVTDVNEDGFKVAGPVVSGMWTDNVLVHYDRKQMDDIIDLDGRTLKILGRTIKKLKVNGFSVSPVIIKTAVLDIEGVTDCFIRTKPTKEKGSEILVLEYTGKKYNNKDMESLLKTKLPFYAIPKKFVYKSVEKWGSTK